MASEAGSMPDVDLRVHYDKAETVAEMADWLVDDPIELRDLALNLLHDVGSLKAALERSEAACATAMAEVEALRNDRAWEAKRANEAARLSAEARDQADDLRRQIVALKEQVSIVEGDRTDNDRWAVNLVATFDLDPPEKLDPYDAIARGLREWRRHVLDAEAKLEAMVRIRGEAKAAEAEVEALGSALVKAVRERDSLARRCATRFEETEVLRATVRYAEADRNVAFAQRDTMRPVVEAAKVWAATIFGANLKPIAGDEDNFGPAELALVAAVDALSTKDGAVPAPVVDEEVRWYVMHDHGDGVGGHSHSTVYSSQDHSGIATETWEENRARYWSTQDGA